MGGRIKGQRMVNKYIFAKDIRPALESGELKVELLPGSKLSPSALDLLRDYEAEAIFSAPAARPKEVPPAGPGEAETALAEKGPEAGPEVSDIQETVREELSEAVSESDVEKILERVMARLSQAKGESFEPTEGAASPAEDDDLIICRCEEITKGQIRAAIAAGMSTLNGVKRVTRAGMGLCQGQTCQRLVTRILCQELGLTPDLVEPTTARPPTRPIPLDLLATG